MVQQTELKTVDFSVDEVMKDAASESQVTGSTNHQFKLLSVSEMFVVLALLFIIVPSHVPWQHTGIFTSICNV